jgi:putative endonuclease
MLFARDRGQQIEKAVGRFLQKQGLRLITRNYHSRHGEIDLIMQDNEVLVFVEVRYRADSRYGTPAETVNYHKQSRISRTAAVYLQSEKPEHSSCRFDVVAVSPSAKGLDMQWIQNAFDQV